MKTRVSAAAVLVAGAFLVVLPASAVAGRKSTHLTFQNRARTETTLALFVDEEAAPRCIAVWKQSCETTLDLRRDHKITYKRVSDGKVCSEGVWGPRPYFDVGKETTFSYEEDCDATKITILDKLSGEQRAAGNLRFFIDDDVDRAGSILRSGWAVVPPGKHRVLVFLEPLNGQTPYDRPCYDRVVDVPDVSGIVISIDTCGNGTAVEPASAAPTDPRQLLIDTLRTAMALQHLNRDLEDEGPVRQANIADRIREHNNKYPNGICTYTQYTVSSCDSWTREGRGLEQERVAVLFAYKRDLLLKTRLMVRLSDQLTRLKSETFADLAPWQQEAATCAQASDVAAAAACMQKAYQRSK